MRILAIKLRRLGDTVLWTSALQALVDHGAVVDVVYPDYYDALFSNDPRFKNRYGLGDTHAGRNILVHHLSQENYDFVLNFHASDTSARLARSFKAKEHIIHHHDRRGKQRKSERPIPHLGEPMKATERDLNLVRAIGWSGQAPKTKIFFDPLVKAEAHPLLPKIEKPLVVLGISASRPAKEWPMEHFVTLSGSLSSIATVAVIYEKETDLRSGYWKEKLASHAHLIQTNTLDDLMKVLTSATLYIGSDSGVKHLGVALGLKTLTLFGPESIGEWHCYEEDQLFLQIPVSCRTNHPVPKEFSWCGEHSCPLASHACMRLISPEVVYQTLFTSLVD